MDGASKSTGLEAFMELMDLYGEIRNFEDTNALVPIDQIFNTKNG